MEEIDPEEATELDYLEFQHMVVEEAMSHNLLDQVAMEHLLDRVILKETAQQQHPRRREDGTTRKPLEPATMRNVLDTMLVSMGFSATHNY